MDNPTGLAGFGQTPVHDIIQRDTKPDETKSKYKDFVDAIYGIAHPEKSEHIDQQTRLEWDNIEGEVMLEVLKADILSGVQFVQVRNPFFNYPAPQTCLDKIFVDNFVEKLQDKHLLPAMSIMKLKLNELMVSHKGMGRAELIQMFQAFSLSMQEHEHNESLKNRGLRLS